MKKTKNKETAKKTSKKNNKKKKNYFEITFVSISILMFFLLVFMVGWLKESLYEAKDYVSIEFIREHETKNNIKSVDPMISPSGDISKEKLAFPGDDGSSPALGKKDAPVRIFYYLDFACSFCQEQGKILREIYEKFSNDVRIIWNVYPDSNFASSFSYQSAKAAYCAHKQGSFWDFEKLIYEKKDLFEDLRGDVFMNIAEELNMNIRSFETCFFSFDTDDFIQEKINEASRLDIVAIPYIYINNKGFMGSLSHDELERYIEYEADK